MELLKFVKLGQPDLLQLSNRLTEASSISINFKIRCILCDIYSTHVFIIIHMNTFQESKGDFPVLVFKIRNHYIVANLTVAVHSAEDCCASSIKLSRKSSTLYCFTVALYIYIHIYIHFIFIYTKSEDNYIVIYSHIKSL